MTDKKIVIDASKCEWRTGVEHYGNYECMLNKCCDYNCDWYKRRKLEQQLKVKEQECDELKKKNYELTEEVSIDRALFSEIDQLKAELEEYKNVVNKLAGMQVILTNEEKMPMLYKNAKDLKLKQLSKTLIEIKEIAKYELNNLTESAINGGRYVEILQKISEVVLDE